MNPILEKLKTKGIKAFLVTRKGKLIESNFDVDESLSAMVANLFNRSAYIQEEMGDKAKEIIVESVVKKLLIHPIGKEEILAAIVANEEELKIVRTIIGEHVH